MPKKKRPPKKPPPELWDDLTDAEKAQLQAEIAAADSLKPPAPRHCERDKLPDDDLPF
jgi:hypothetical protein